MKKPLFTSDRFNIELEGIHKNPWTDMYFHLLKSRWPVYLLLLATSYLLFNLAFAVIYYFHLDGIANIQPQSFLDAFSFSIQTSSTIGYGHLYPISLTVKLLVALQAILAIIYVALITGLTFAKFSRPRAKIKFTNNMLISQYYGKPHLVFRVANARFNQINDANIKVAAVVKENTPEGKSFRKIYDLNLVRQNTPVMVLTWTIMHPLDESSPLYGHSLDALKEKHLDIVISLNGVDDTFKQHIHAKHSYTADNIIENKDFEDMLFIKDDGTRQINFNNLNKIKS